MIAYHDISFKSGLSGLVQHQFCAQGTKDNTCDVGPGYFMVQNAKESPFVAGLENCRPFFRNGSDLWRRTSKPAVWIEERLTFETPDLENEVALYPPYYVRDLKRSLNFEIDPKLKPPIITLGDKGKPCLIIMARQRPGDVTSSHFMDGILYTLSSQEYLRSYLNMFRLIIIPMACYSGVKLGHFWQNTEYIDLTSDWGFSMSSEVKTIKGFLEQEKIQNPFLFLELCSDFVNPLHSISNGLIHSEFKPKITEIFYRISGLFKKASGLDYQLPLFTPTNTGKVEDYMEALGFQTVRLSLSAIDSTPAMLHSTGYEFTLWLVDLGRTLI